MITGIGICPYSEHSPEDRARWHRKHGVDDPLLKAKGGRVAGDPFPDEPAVEVYVSEVKGKTLVEVFAGEKPQEVVDPPMPDEETIRKPDGMTKEQRYREANKERLAERARERRAKQKEGK